MSTASVKPKTLRFPWAGKNLFYGWIVVVIGAITQFFQGIASQGFASYLGPLQTEFGWNKATLAGPRSITQIEGAITGPLEGYLVDRFGARKVVNAGIFIMGLGFILFGITHSLWMYYLSSIVIALGTGFQGLLVMSVTVNNWFRRKRSIAQSLMGLGYSLAGVAGVPALVIIQTNFGWRPSTIWTGILIWAIGFPVAAFLRTRPESIGVLPDGDTPQETSPDGNARHKAAHQEYDFTLAGALKTRTFWLLAVTWAIGNLGLLGVQVHLFLHLQGIGLSRATAALVWTIASLSSVPSRIMGGFFGDKFPKHIMIAISMAFMAIAIYVLAIAGSVQMAFTYAVLFGIGWGMRTPIANAIQGEYFGTKSQGIIRGWLNSLSLPIAITAPVLAGHMADVQGTYRWAFMGIAVVSLIGAGLALLATHPKPHAAA